MHTLGRSDHLQSTSARDWVFEAIAETCLKFTPMTKPHLYMTPPTRRDSTDCA